MSLFRCHNWLKNCLLFTPLLFSPFPYTLQDLNFSQVIIIFFSFSLLTSSVYIFNDLIDIQNDQAHPIKKDRLFASGAISLSNGWLLLLILLFVTFIICIQTSTEIMLIHTLYFAMNILYSLQIKKIIYLDLILLSFFYILRIYLGIIVFQLNIPVHHLIYFFIFFINLAAIKRIAEFRSLRLMYKFQKIPGRGYSEKSIMRITTVSVFITTVIFPLIAYSFYDVQISKLSWGIRGLYVVLNIIICFWFLSLLHDSREGRLKEDLIKVILFDTRGGYYIFCLYLFIRGGIYCDIGKFLE